MRELFGIGSGTLIACACVAANWGNTIYRVYYAIRVYIVSTILAEMQKENLFGKAHDCRSVCWPGIIINK